MRFRFTRDADEYAALAGAFLAERVERNLLATVLVHAREGRAADGSPLFAWAQSPTGAIEGAALRTPPRPMLCSELDAAAAGDLMEAWLARDPAPGAVNAATPTARALAASFRRLTGGGAHCRMRETMQVLTRVRAPSDPPSGMLRAAGEADRELLFEWERAFAAEAGVPSPDPARIVESRIERDAQFVWDDGGCVSTLAVSPVVAGTARIGPVYTPPERRGRGYATAAVAALCGRLLAAGADRCALFTDLANPTSNRIYANVGFARIGDWEEHALVPLGDRRARTPRRATSTGLR